MSLANICIWLSICLVLVAAALFVVAYWWRKALVELEAERKKNKHFMEQVRVVEQKLENAWRTYDKLSHSWPFPTPETSDEEHQKLVDGFWKEEQK